MKNNVQKVWKQVNSISVIVITLLYFFFLFFCSSSFPSSSLTLSSFSLRLQSLASLMNEWLAGRTSLGILSLLFWCRTHTRCCSYSFSFSYKAKRLVVSFLFHFQCSTHTRCCLPVLVSLSSFLREFDSICVWGTYLFIFAVLCVCNTTHTYTRSPSPPPPPPIKTSHMDMNLN